MISLIINLLRKVKRILLCIRETCTEMIGFGRCVILVGYPYSKNFGDAWGVTLVKELTGKVIVFNHFSAFKLFDKWLRREKYAVIGSIIDHCDQDTIVWGAGCLSLTDLPKVPPKKILAVRGPKTRELLLKNEIDCPAVFGDPALLLPALYNPVVAKESVLGIIPHYLDKRLPILKLLESKGVKIIDIDVRHNWTFFIDQVMSCDHILSSSLHGLIVADVYGVKTQWVELSNNVEGNGFKFYDYYNSIGISDADVYVHHLHEDNTIDELITKCTRKEIRINLQPLISNCPFPFIDRLTRA